MLDTGGEKKINTTSKEHLASQQQEFSSPLFTPISTFPSFILPLSKNSPPRNFSTEEQVCSQRQPALSKHTHTLLLPEGNLHKTPHFVLGSKGLLL